MRSLILLFGSSLIISQVLAGAAGFILLCGHQKDRVLMLKDKRGFWDVPFGGRDRGESVWEAATREFHEETGIRLPEDFEHIKATRRSRRISSSKNRLDIGGGSWYYVGWVPTCDFERYGMREDHGIDTYYNKECDKWDTPTVAELWDGSYQRTKVRSIAKTALKYADRYGFLDHL